MKKISLNEEQQKNLCEELARLTFEFRKDNRVECIYFAPYINLENITGNVIDFTIVGNNSYIKDIDDKIKEYNIEHQNKKTVDKYGVKFNLKVDSFDQYSIVAMHSYEIIREIFLFNSKILFDKTGEYAKLKEQAIEFSKKPNTYIKYYTNLAQFEPPIDNKLNNAIDIEREKRDREAVKEFTKSNLFNKIKNM